jgi:hypothetical protein
LLFRYGACELAPAKHWWAVVVGGVLIAASGATICKAW